MKRVLYIILTLLMLFVSCLTAFAHPGKTDGKGGHYDRDTGQYHYHHGYPAHQHENGVCPYDFDDKTDHSSPSKSNKLNVGADDEEDGISGWLIVLIVIGGAIVISAIIGFIKAIIEIKRRS